MNIEVVKSKIHRVKVTGADLNYIGSITIDMDLMEAANIFEGEKNIIERINITGNNATDEDVIRGELIIDEGDPLTNLSLEKSIAEVKERRIFKDVKYEVLEGSEKNLKIININVDEQSTGEISAGAGIGSSGGTVAFTIKENNWLGQGKSLGLDVQFDEESIIGKSLLW